MSDSLTVNNVEKMLRSLGLCARAGKIVCGVPMICEAMRKGGKGAPLLVIEASDTSENTHKKINDKCTFYGVRRIKISADAQTLALSVGKSAALGAVAITDRDMLCLIEKYID